MTTTRMARVAADDLDTVTSRGVRGGARAFDDTTALSRDELERQLRDRDYQGVTPHAVSVHGQALRDLTEEMITRSRLRELERERWSLGRQLDEHPTRERLARRLDDAEAEYRSLTAELTGHIARRTEAGHQPWEVRNSDQTIGELRNSENRRHEGRLRLDALTRRRAELRAELRGLRGETTAAGGPGTSAARESRWRDLEIRYDDRTARELRDLTEARDNIDWMVSEQAKEQRRLEREVRRLENDIPKERERLVREHQRQVEAARREQERQVEAARREREQQATAARREQERQEDAARREQARQEREERREQAARDRAVRNSQREVSALRSAPTGPGPNRRADGAGEGDSPRSVVDPEARGTHSDEQPSTPDTHTDEQPNTPDTHTPNQPNARSANTDGRSDSRGTDSEGRPDSRRGDTGSGRTMRNVGVGAGIGVAAVAAGVGISAVADTDPDSADTEAGDSDTAADEPGDSGSADTRSGEPDTHAAESGSAHTGDAEVTTGATERAESGSAGTGPTEAGGTDVSGTGTAGAAAGTGVVGAAAPGGGDPFYTGGAETGPSSGSAPVTDTGSGTDLVSGTGSGDSSSIDALDAIEPATVDSPSVPNAVPTPPPSADPLGGAAGFDPSSLMLPLWLSNMQDPGLSDTGPDEDVKHDSDRYHDSGPNPGTQQAAAPQTPQRAVTTPWPQQASGEQTSDDAPAGRDAEETAPRPVSSPARERNGDGRVEYTHIVDGVVEWVSASVARAFEVAYSNKGGTDAKAAYADTDARWADENELARVGPLDLMSGDVITFDHGAAVVRVQRKEGDPEGGVVDVVIKGELTPIAPVMADGVGGLGGFAGFRHPPGIESPGSAEEGAGPGVPASDDGATMQV
ncbi:hypothetical protein ACWCPQ_21150 [Nocardia sp. NPDC001965]